MKELDVLLNEFNKAIKKSVVGLFFIISDTFVLTLSLFLYVAVMVILSPLIIIAIIWKKTHNTPEVTQ